MNDLDDRLQRLAVEATKDVTAPDLAVIVRRGRRRQAPSGPVLAGTVALVLVLAGAVALAAVRGRADRLPVGPAPTTAPPSTSVPTDRWKTYTDAAHNLRFRYPPDWVVRRRHQEGMVTLAPAEQARRMLANPPTFAVTVGAGGAYDIGEAPEPGMTRGRLPGGQPYLRWDSEVDPSARPGITASTAPGAAGRARVVGYSIDGGRDCKGVKLYRCGPHGVNVTIHANDAALWNRYIAAAEGSSTPPDRSPHPAVIWEPQPAGLPSRPMAGDLARGARRCRRPAVLPQRWCAVPGGPGLPSPRPLAAAHPAGRPAAPVGWQPVGQDRGRRPSRGRHDQRRRVMGNARGAAVLVVLLGMSGATRGWKVPRCSCPRPNGQRLRIGGPDPATNASPSPAFRGCQDRGEPSRLAPRP